MAKPFASASELLSQIIEELRERDSAPLSYYISLLGERSTAFAILLCSLISAIPSVPGVGAVAGLPIIWLGLQLCIGIGGLWLPKSWQQHGINRHKWLPMFERAKRYVLYIESFSKPRWLIMSDRPARIFLGIICICMALLVALPIPFTNTPFAMCLILLSLGIIERDGIMIAIGILASAIGISLTSLSIFALIENVNAPFSNLL